jgi:hypothetical protein
MQMKYLREIDEKFALPVLRFPMLQEEVRGLELLRKAGADLGCMETGLREECA